MSTPITIVARLVAKEGTIDTVKIELLKFRDASRKEDGCLQCDLHQDAENSASFVFYENWASKKHWLDHTDNSNIKAYLKAAQELTENFTFEELTKI